MAATVQAARGDEAVGTVVADIKELAERVRLANEEIGRRMSVVRGATDETAGSVRAVKFLQQVQLFYHIGAGYLVHDLNALDFKDRNLVDQLAP